MSDTSAASYVARHGLERLRVADPDGFDAALAQVAGAGAAMPRPTDKESGPAPVFLPGPISDRRPTGQAIREQ